MKVLRSTEWLPMCWVPNFPVSENDIAPRFLFRHRKYDDVLALNAAKYVDVTADIVYFYDASLPEADRVSVSRKPSRVKTQLPALVWSV